LTGLPGDGQQEIRPHLGQVATVLVRIGEITNDFTERRKLN